MYIYKKKTVKHFLLLITTVHFAHMDKIEKQTSQPFISEHL